MSLTRWLTVLTIVAQLLCIGIALEWHPIIWMLYAGYAFIAGAVLITLSSGSETGIRFFKFLAVIGSPFVVMLLFYVYDEGNLFNRITISAAVFVAAYAVQAMMILLFMPKAERPYATSGHQLTGHAGIMQDTYDHDTAIRAEIRRQKQRERALRAESDNVMHEGRIRALEIENDKLRHEVLKLRTILADPFHDPIPMEQEIK